MSAHQENLQRAGNTSGLRPSQPTSRAGTSKLSPTSVCRPSARDVSLVWESCSPVSQDGEVAQWLESRSLDSSSIDLWDLARALPVKAELPSWSSTKSGSWAESDHRLLFQLWDSSGEVVSLRARSISHVPTTAKSLAPSGFSTNGLVLADPLAAQLLATGPPDWWEPTEIVISEGEIDWLTWASLVI